MRYFALATDYDGTLAHHGVVDEETIHAVERLAHSGRKIILVTGRELPDLESVFGRLDLFARIVAENGAVLYNPATREKQALGRRPPDRFVASLKEKGVTSLSVGDVIVATWHPHEQQVLDSIRELGLELQVIFNKDAVMILPSGINKMTGLDAALAELKISRHNVVGVGDAENDHAFLGCSECAVAVQNAIPALKERADLITEGASSAGVRELIERILDTDLEELGPQLAPHRFLLGHVNETAISLDPHDSNVLLCGKSGSGKSTLVSGLLERIAKQGYQVCLIDPEGEYENFPGYITIGDENHAPSFDQMTQVLDDTKAQVVLSLLGVPMGDRASYFASVLTAAQKMRVETGRPHWLVVDEAHHTLPEQWSAGASELAGDFRGVVLVTVHPKHLAPAVLHPVNVVIVVGDDARTSLSEVCAVIGVEPPAFQEEKLSPGEALVWFRARNELLPKVALERSRSEHNRHKRKYAQGAIKEDRVFYFRGPEKKLKLRAANLLTFIQLSAGVDDNTWLFHLKQGDYSAWFRHSLKDASLADEAERVERDPSLSPQRSRELIKNSIEARYTASA
jgi:HAD superfamily hydrolase (TIGR01484 family)